MNYGVCLEMQFPDRPFLDRIGAARRAGVRFAEMWFTDRTAWTKGMNPNDAKHPAKVRAAAAKAGVTLTNTVIGSPDGSIGGGLTDSRNRRVWLARARATLEFCREAGIGAAIVCTGNLAKGPVAATPAPKRARRPQSYHGVGREAEGEPLAGTLERQD
jgi:sugar phosphate isomerase/epimerase